MKFGVAFMECETCAAKPGSPPLCRGCLHNRFVIEAFRATAKPAGLARALKHLNTPVTR